jgi:type I restriction enzyme M protein
MDTPRSSPMQSPVKLDEVTLFVARYLFWAREARVCATFLPLIVYRGHECETWELLPTLCREQNKKLPLESLKLFESELLEEFPSRFDLPADWTKMEVLAFARHHGAPTRLLDWSRNPLIGLWFAVANKNFDSSPGAVYQLRPPEDTSLIAFCLGKPSDVDLHGSTHPIQVFPSPSRIDRTERQSSVFTLVSFEGGHVRTPLDKVGTAERPVPVRKFTVPAHLKPQLRRLLSDLGLDDYAIFGDADSFGRVATARLDLSGLNVDRPSTPGQRGVMSGSGEESKE